MTDMRSTQAVQVTEQFAASCEEILELQIATKSWVAVEFDLDSPSLFVCVVQHSSVSIHTMLGWRSSPCVSSYGISNLHVTQVRC